MARTPAPKALRGYLDQNDVTDLPKGLDGFLGFYENRRRRLESGWSPCSVASPDH